MKDFTHIADKQNEGLLNDMKSHFKKADKLGKIFLTLWCLSAVWFFYNLNAKVIKMINPTFKKKENSKWEYRIYTQLILYCQFLCKIHNHLNYTDFENFLN